MANIQLFGPFHFQGVLAPGQTAAMSTGILVPVPPESGNLAFVVTARPERTGPHVFAAGIRDISVVNNDPPGGLNLNFVIVNTHATQPLESVRVTVAAIS
jgi:hypothetical protein